MRFIRFIFWILILAIFVLVLAQNMDQIKNALTLNFVLDETTVFNITYPIYVYFLGFFMLGAFMGTLYFITDKLRAGGALSSCRSRVRALEKEVEQLRSIPLDETPTAAAAAPAETPTVYASSEEEKKDQE